MVITVAVSIFIDRDKSKSWTVSVDVEPVGDGHIQVQNAIYGLSSPGIVETLLEKARK